jgi:hypothetical protein
MNSLGRVAGPAWDGMMNVSGVEPIMVTSTCVNLMSKLLREKLQN